MTNELSFAEEDLARKLIRPAITYESGNRYDLNFSNLLDEVKRLYLDIPATHEGRARRRREWDRLLNEKMAF